ncbi:growth hormone-regulated TBC protein 1 [Tupaia chinensis]|uniref:growth hormone-regulated TBC protein 1 n=1 Tax=Tupaia chinensis TaxID=246437 RepID=UPI000FFBF721|nr:growth hormone-regulated TBC protein 1 [Tupaia chinensis]
MSVTTVPTDTAEATLEPAMGLTARTLLTSAPGFVETMPGGSDYVGVMQREELLASTPTPTPAAGCVAAGCAAALSALGDSALTRPTSWGPDTQGAQRAPAHASSHGEPHGEPLRALLGSLPIATDFPQLEMISETNDTRPRSLPEDAQEHSCRAVLFWKEPRATAHGQGSEYPGPRCADGAQSTQGHGARVNPKLEDEGAQPSRVCNRGRAFEPPRNQAKKWQLLINSIPLPRRHEHTRTTARLSQQGEAGVTVRVAEVPHFPEPRGTMEPAWQGLRAAQAAGLWIGIGAGAQPPAGTWACLCCRVDPYGFEQPENLDSADEAFLSAYPAVLARRAAKWSRLLKARGGVRRSPTVKRYVRKGIPLALRAHVWMALSGAQERMDQNPGYYQRLLQGERDRSIEEAIKTDLNRTFPDNVQFRKTAEPCLQKTLCSVLLAYGHHNRGVGYCQGLNFIAGYLILVTKNEEQSFWLLDALVGRILPDYYGPAMLGLKTDQEVLGELVRAKLPAVAALVEGCGMQWTLLVSRWFICLFVDVLPVETVLRVWDCLFNEGSKILFRVALTLIKQHQEFILEATDISDLCDRFKQITRGSFVTECHTFMQKIFSEPGSLPMTAVTRLRERCRARLLAQG